MGQKTEEAYFLGRSFESKGNRVGACQTRMAGRVVGVGGGSLGFQE